MTILMINHLAGDNQFYVAEILCSKSCVQYVSHKYDVSSISSQHNVDKFVMNVWAEQTVLIPFTLFLNVVGRMLILYQSSLVQSMVHFMHKQNMFFDVRG